MIDHRTTPPRQAERFVAWLLADRRWREVTLGDLAEEFEDRLRRGTPARARAWYWSQALALIPARLIDPLRSFFAPTGDSLARSVVTEVRLACRALMHQPLLTSLVVVTLALGLGSNAVTFGLVDRLVLRPFDIADVDRLVLISEHVGNQRRNGIPIAHFLEWRDRVASLQELVAFRGFSSNFSGTAQPERIDGQAVSAGFFTLLGVSPAYGRAFDRRDEVSGNHRVAILGHALWRRRFEGDPRAVGRTIRLDGQEYSIVGIAPRGFDLPDGSQIWVPLDIHAEDVAGRSTRSVSAIARLAQGSDITAAGAEMSATFARQQAADATIDRRRRITVWSFATGMVDTGTPRLLGLVEITAVLVLIIACVNIAGLLLARGAERHRDLGVRQALGASRGQLVRQLLVENLVLSLAAVPATLAVAWGLFQLLHRTIADDVVRFIPGWAALGIDTRVLLVLFGGAILCALVFGLLPALTSSGVSPSVSLRDGGRSIAGGPGRLRQGLVVLQIALALPLLAVSGAAALAGQRLIFGPQGYNPDGVYQLRTILPRATYPDEAAQREFVDRLLEATRSVPGVTIAGVASVLPSSNTYSDRRIFVDGGGDRSDSPNYVNFREVSADYLPTMEIPIVSGRGLAASDRADALRVAVISESLARRYFPEGSPIGKRLRIDPDQAWSTVVGVSRDTLDDWINARGIPTVYVPFAQSPTNSINVVARTNGDPASLSDGLRLALASVDADQPVFNGRPMRDLIHWRTSGLRFLAGLMTWLGLLAVTLATLGVYGLMANSVARRRHEFGVRMALGASGRDVLALTIRHGAVLTAGGVGLGLAAAGAVLRLMDRSFYGLFSAEPALLMTTAGGLTAVALAATIIPARRATRLDPATVLKE